MDDHQHITKRVSILTGMLRWLKEPSNPYHEHYLLILVMLLGLRRAENLGLTWDCLHQLSSKNGAQLTVKQQLIYVPREGTHIQPTTKNKKVRTILLPEAWRQAFIERKKEGRKANEAWANDLVFIQRNGRHLDYNTYNQVWHECLRAYMLKDGNRTLHETDEWRPHSNRKVFATLLGETGTPVSIAVSLLGHSSEAMTFYYMAATDSAKMAGMAGVSKRLNL